ncbi:saccharopine dehydrogenase family protein [Hydrogenophaga sp. IBVHS1]|uniref:saccharopine dehydrogenase family protein n=1 Tax=Hydrogenophaga sp. IBVHS1 TaxID=1985169 RepID=UPI000A2E7742|nr:saccharopine dehydrogenase NADP-binding domain-containing protein [Hydrogenophaga sp. IBVHS1]OSZ76541.1 saccharopine dehydrogenase [Hydrogenophaga sp. IBVHS1]
MSALKTLVLGGYGNFGARIARALVNEPGIDVVVGGRDLLRAAVFAAGLGGGAQALRVDAASPSLAATLQANGIGLVIHTAGPFQAQGHGVALACAAAGCHYVDLADGRRFVCDFPAALHETFQRAGRSAITGASTVPALSSAVVEHLCAGWQAIYSVDICIAPAQSAPRGVATLAGVLSYCGAPVSVWQEGRWQPRTGWAQPEPVRFARMKPRLGALCDVPDLEIFPERYRVRDRVMFRAALEVGLSQRAFAWIAAARSKGWLFRPEKLARLLHWSAPVLNPWGSALGGMVVRVSGLDSQGEALQRAWHLSADNDHGPEIPAMPAILLARRLAQGHALPVGAHTATGLIPLASFTPEFARWGMVTDEA